MFWIVLIIAALFFSWRNYKKKQTADCGPYRRGERKRSSEGSASRYPTAAMGAGAS